MRASTPRTTPLWLVRFFWTAVVCVMAGLLTAVAVMQYRATNQISEATEARIGGNVESLMMDWHLDFYRRFSSICVALQVGPDSGAFDDWAAFSDRYAQWRRTTPTAELVQGLYVWETSQKTAPRLLRLSPVSGPPVEAEPEASFNPLLNRLVTRSTNLHSGLRAWQPADSQHRTIPASQRYLSLQSDPLTGWQFDQNIPAIVHPIVHHKPPTGNDDPASPEAIDWIIVVLDMHIIQTKVLPELALRHFGVSNAADYSIVVAALGSPNRVLYDAAPEKQGNKIDQSDAAMNIFGPPPGSVEGDFWEAIKNANSVRVQNWRHFSSPIWFPVIEYSDQDSPWVLILTHRTGHLEDTVAGVRRVNLFASSAIVLMLAASITLVVIAGHRARNYARLQLDFMASISHELRTPLTAIYSAGENLADGVVQDKEKTRHYGSIITGQARQLIALVDQILTFASTRNDKKRYEMRLLGIEQIIDLALRNTNTAIEAGNFQVDRKIAPDLPSVEGDLNAIASCLQNLLSNAVKYSGKSRLISISAHLARVKDKCEVQIDVEDRGIGIDSAELTHVFKPFYRCSQATAAQIHGTGLGLAVATEIADAMGGRLSVRSSLGVGSVFTLSLPCADRQPVTTLFSGDTSPNE